MSTPGIHMASGAGAQIALGMNLVRSALLNSMMQQYLIQELNIRNSTEISQLSAASTVDQYDALAQTTKKDAMAMRMSGIQTGAGAAFEIGFTSFQNTKITTLTQNQNKLGELSAAINKQPLTDPALSATPPSTDQLTPRMKQLLVQPSDDTHIFNPNSDINQDIIGASKPKGRLDQIKEAVGLSPSKEINWEEYNANGFQDDANSAPIDSVERKKLQAGIKAHSNYYQEQKENVNMVLSRTSNILKALTAASDGATKSVYETAKAEWQKRQGQFAANAEQEQMAAQSMGKSYDATGSMISTLLSAFQSLFTVEDSVASANRV